MPPDLRDDAGFDDQLPVSLQPKSPVHFTPVEVARQAASLLAPEPGMTVLDVGAGVGKFCIAAALAQPAVKFVGVEQRPHLVQIANRLARVWGLSNARFVHADALHLDWSRFDAFYFFNPFGEHLFTSALVLDRTIELTPSTFLLYVTAVHERLARARPGTRVVTYHGYGGPPPASYELIRDEAVGTDRLALWIKTRPSRRSSSQSRRTAARRPRCS
ncbi:MAG TPA: class I SAM-dependent methyltransferase [Kofleriaceae bacterium]|nr:class I SAM-dependent methyltransferase [Kofleriaceae bacterium]